MTEVTAVFPMVELVQSHVSFIANGAMPLHSTGPIRDDLTNSVGRQQLQA